MKIGTGAAVSIIPEGIYLYKLSQHPLVKSKVVLKTYSEERLQLLGEVKSPVQYQSQRDTLTVFVVKGNNPPFLGSRWVNEIKAELVKNLRGNK